MPQHRPSSVGVAVVASSASCCRQGLLLQISETRTQTMLRGAVLLPLVLHYRYDHHYSRIVAASAGGAGGFGGAGVAFSAAPSVAVVAAYSSANSEWPAEQPRTSRDTQRTETRRWFHFQNGRRMIVSGTHASFKSLLNTHIGGERCIPSCAAKKHRTTTSYLPGDRRCQRPEQPSSASAGWLEVGTRLPRFASTHGTRRRWVTGGQE